MKVPLLCRTWRPKKLLPSPLVIALGNQKQKYRVCPEAQAESSSRKSLFTSEQSACLSKKPVPWSDQETECLFQYICSCWKDPWTNMWPSVRDPVFWKGAADALNKTCN